MQNMRSKILVALAGAATAVGLGVALGPVSTEAAPAPLAAAAPAPAGGLAGGPASASVDAQVAVINAFFAKHCVACHGPEKKKADLVLHTLSNAPALVANRKTVQHALNLVKTSEMPPDSRPQPTVHEMDDFAGAVAKLYAETDRFAKPDPGRVTVRRLNRTEYNNTIRDLLGVDARPADDFPADDIGHGFDNIGDVLTLSPVLMERYLAAAEVAAKSAVPTSWLKGPQRWQGARYLEPAGNNVPTSKFRPVPKGRLFNPLHIGNDGQYVLRTKLYARKIGDEKVRASFTLDDKVLRTFDVEATTEKDAQVVEMTIHLEPGDYKVGVEIANPSATAKEIRVSWDGKAGEKKKAKAGGKKQDDADPTDWLEDNERAIFVEHIALNGPADNRPPSLRRLMDVADAKAPKAEQLRQILSAFASRAYRRPATKDEVDRLVAIASQIEAETGKMEEGVQVAIQAVLVSPKFLFRLELDDRPESPEPRPLDDYALASRLSYFLWSTMPDDELLALAGKKQLSQQLEPQIKRMLADPKAVALVDNFAMQWLQLKRLKSFSPDPAQFPKFDESLRSDMQTETEMFLTAIIQEDRSVLDLIDADFTFLNERLAKHYNIGDTNGNTAYAKKPERAPGQRIPYNRFVRVSLPPNSQRGGLLTQASILAVTSNPTRTSPVKRGKWVLEQILGAPPPPPPPDVPELASGGEALKGTLRQRMEAHRANPACAGCHAKMDPIGFAFENFDAVGAFRWQDGGANIDPSGVLPDGSSFKGAPELRKMLVEKRKDAFVRSLTEKLMIYGLGRGLEHYDDRAVAAAVKNVEADGYKFSRLIAEVVKSDPFMKRRGL